MGVSGFHKYLESKNLVRPIPSGFTVGCVCVDLADLLHVNIRKSNTPTQLLKNVVAALKNVVKRLRLKMSSGQPGALCIFMDGSAPLAKLSLQIKRRRTQSARGKSEQSKNNQKHQKKTTNGKQKKKKKRGGGLSSLLLTPGTSLMIYLEKELRKAFPNAYVSGTDEPGEGEIKAIHYLLTHRRRYQAERKMLLGGDADLVLLAAAARPLNRVTCAKVEQNKFTGVSVDQFLQLKQHFTREGEFVVLFGHYTPDHAITSRIQHLFCSFYISSLNNYFLIYYYLLFTNNHYFYPWSVLDETMKHKQDGHW